MAKKLITCGACGTKNASRRTVCLRCGADLAIDLLPEQEEGQPSQPGREPFLRRTASFLKSLNLDDPKLTGATKGRRNVNRRRLIKILTAVAVLYVVILIAFVLWVIHDTKRNNWLIDRVADPAAAFLPNVSEDDWAAILASPNFASKSSEERISIANQQFAKIKALADAQLYDLKALQRWYQQTAADFKRYPVQKFVFAQGMETHYRDLRQSGFPKPSAWGVFWAVLFNKYAMLVALIGIPFVAILVLFIAGIIIAVFSRSLSLKWRALVIVLVVIILGEVWLIRNAAKHPVSLGLYSFVDSGDYISVQGTWTSNIKLAGPLQVTQLDCWREWNHCIEARAQILYGNLNVITVYWEIKNWGVEELTFKDIDHSLCKVQSLHVDRKSKIVTATNALKRPKLDSCINLEDDPVVTHLVAGYKLRYQ